MSFWYQSIEINSATVNMPPRRGASIGWGRPVANAVLLDETWNLHTRMETTKTAQRRALDEGDANAT